MNTKEEILDSINVICVSKEVADQIKAGIAGASIDISPLLNTTIIQMENTLNGRFMQDCTGIDIALELLNKESHRRVILYHVMPIKFIRQKNQKADMLLAKQDRVRLLESPFTPEALITAFNSDPIEIESIDSATALAKHVKGALTGIYHDLKKAADPLNPETGWQTEMVNGGFAKARETFAMLADKDNAYILKFLEEISADREEVRKGERLAGIFCDMEGTLFTNGTLNTAVLEALKKHEAEGKEITLWTDGDIAELQSLLDANNITYILHPKRSYAGAIVEMAIDDMDENSFTALTKIYAEKFIRTGDIAF